MRGGTQVSKHSPGPWRVGGHADFVAEAGNPHFEESEHGRDIWTVENGLPVPVIELEDWYEDADLRLIAAAPRMLELLREYAHNACEGGCLECSAGAFDAAPHMADCRLGVLLAEIDGEDNATKETE